MGSLDLGSIFDFDVPVLEIIVRGTLMYWFLFILFRFVIRRDVGSIGIADVLFVVLVADASQNAMAGEYTTLSDGVVLVLTLAFWNVMLDWLSWRIPWLEKLIEPRPILLIKDGRVLYRELRRQFISLDDLKSKLRMHGIENFSEVRRAYMESDGDVSVIERKKK
ncbi:DUF421 domain-containing protein [Uliginosibacterium sp. sgz301328]|uniref:DUF421 domain-containing protein n=1 Tax=Uliginosibacterium sp. sgz301328 TaxID=3243764 RepID=UPI00359D89B6